LLSGAGSSWDHDDGDFEEEEEVTELVGDPAMLRLALKNQEPVRAPPVPELPAMPSTPPKTVKKIPAELLNATKHKHKFSQHLDSSVGRGLIFCLTLFAFIVSAICLIIWRVPSLQQKSQHWPILILMIISLVALFIWLPLLAEEAGMRSDRTGWKPYLAMYRGAHLTAVSALLCFAFGYGEAIRFGTPQGSDSRELSISSLEPDSGGTFEAVDGFVALNLTKGVSETLRAYEHGDVNFRRISRFHDAELRVNKEPFSDQVEPTVPPGMLGVFVVAPVFASWAPCVSRYRVSTTCLSDNKVLGWAIAQTESLCSDFGMVACKTPQPQIECAYQCSSDSPIMCSSTGGGLSVTGLCGRVVAPPKEAVVDELRALLLLDGWSSSSLPNSEHVWFDLRPDPCIAHPEECNATWQFIGHIGSVLAVLTVLCIIIPAALDCCVDGRIRQARKLWNAVHKPRVGVPV